MPRGEAAILRFVNARLDTSGLGRFWSRVRIDSSSILPVSSLFRRVGVKRFSPRVLVLSAGALAAIAIGAVAVSRNIGKARAGEVAAGHDVRSQHADAKVKAGSAVAAHTSDRNRPFPADYQILLTRSMFAANGSAGGGSAGSAQARAAADGIPPATFALKGISQEDASFTAFVEDTNARRMIEIHSGDTLGQGQVHDITLHDLNYEIDGKTVRVAIGQGMDGNPWIPVTRSNSDSSKSDSGAKSEHKHKHGSDGGEVRASSQDDGN